MALYRCMEVWSRAQWRDLEARVARVVRDWKRLATEPAVGPDDLQQELFLRAWDYWQQHKDIPPEGELRKWAWEALRRHGFRGASGGALASPPDSGGVPVEELEADSNCDGHEAAGHPRLAPSAEYEALRQEFWARMSPALRAQVEELAGARTWRELAQLWGFPDEKACLRYVRGPLRRRMQREGVLEILHALVRLR